MTDHRLPKVRKLMSEGKGEDAISRALDITRHTARKLVLEVERADKASSSGGPVEIPVALCRASPTARPVKPGHVLVLAESIKEIGLRQPINVRAIEGGYEIRGGGHRHAAFVMLGRETIPAIVTDDNDLRAELAEIDENLIRNEYSPAERAIAIARRKLIYEELHPETKPTSEGGEGRHKATRRQAGDESVPERFTKSTAEATGKSERAVQRDAQRGEVVGADILQRVIGTSLDKGEEIDALAKLSPEKREEVISKAEAGDRVSAKIAVKQERREDREADLAQSQRELPNKRYGVIYADPAWRFGPYSRDTGMSRAADNHYPTMTLADIMRLGVNDIAADDCILFMWTTGAMLIEALYVAEAWGFLDLGDRADRRALMEQDDIDWTRFQIGDPNARYKSQQVWHKVYAGNMLGTGYWFRTEHETLMVFTRGSVPAPAMGSQYRSVISEIVGAHSVKPDKFYEMIETYFPNLPKIELNARRARPGWDAWGLEAPINEAAEAAE